MKLLSVVGARPNFMKLAPLSRCLARDGGAEHVIVHTGQHYDHGMSQTFFDELEINAPDANLEVGSGSHALQTARIMERIEPVLLERQPDMVVVYGDVNSTVAASLVAAKLGIRIAHVEAGLRSRDWSMPEEINRLVTDRLADVLLTPSRDADANLRAEGVPDGHIHFVGNIMIDSVVHALPRARATGAPAKYVGDGPFAVVTLHRPGNVDDPERFATIMAAIGHMASRLPVVFPVHPRTRARLAAVPGLHPLDPIPYLEMLSLVERAALVVTDSGGLQEETSFLGVPCLTVRPNTERPVTVTHGTNQLVSDVTRLQGAIDGALSTGQSVKSKPIELWDGHTADRIVAVLRKALL